MKKFFTFLLCAALTLGLIACSNNTPAEEANQSQLQVGFGRTDITPTESVQLHGYFNAETRWSDTILDPLYATCIAFTDSEGSTVLLFHMDICVPNGSKLPFARKAVADAVGLPIDHVMVAATHTHSGPKIDSEHNSMLRYTDYLKEQMVTAAQAAMADRKPAQMYSTSTTLENMNFVRHYRMDDGSVIGDNFGTTEGKAITSHMRNPDKEMQLIRFKREGGKDVVLVNWQVHPHRTGGENLGNISADIVGAMRMYMEPRMDCHMAYFTGASGNLNPTSRIGSENITLDYIDQGTMMAQEAILACDNMTQQQTGKVQILRKDQVGSKEGNPVKFMTFAFSLGDVAFVTAPYEMFDTNGRYIKDNSPFNTTFVVTCANLSGGYMPAEWAYYEDVQAYEVGNGGYDKGTAETLANGFVEMLNELHPTR